MNKVVILWLRNDLRIHDNPALSLALIVCDQIIPVYVFESRIGETKKSVRINIH